MADRAADAVCVTCQMCMTPLTLVGSAEAADSKQQQLRGLAASVFDGANVDESFIVLDRKRQVAGSGSTAAATSHGMGPSGRGMEESFVVLGSAALRQPPTAQHPHSQSAHAGRHPQQQQAGQPPPISTPSSTSRPSMEQQQGNPVSPSAASDSGRHQQRTTLPHSQPHTPRTATTAATEVSAVDARSPAFGGGNVSGTGDSRGGGGDRGSGGSSSGGSAFGLDQKLQALATLFEMASTQTLVDHPLCLDCAAQLKDEIDAQVQETEREITAYTEAISQLEADGAAPVEAAAFEAETARLLAEEERERRRAEQLEADLAAVQRELSALHASSADVDALEERYWHNFNDYQLQLRTHIDDRDALLNRIDRTSQRLQLLKNTNVYNDAFKIWHDGAFGTISGFRLGRTAEVHVEWDEINAAWGQAVLLLHTMAQSCQVIFTTCRLLPMGSHPRVADKRNTYDLFGPVSKLWSANYDRAMICYLGCLQEFGAHAKATDIASRQHPPFEFPFAIDGDKVNGHTIKLTLSKDARWTKALKFMLADLKVALQWMVKHEVETVPTLAHLLPEGPASSLTSQ